MKDINAILRRMNAALAELHRCHAELGAIEASTPPRIEDTRLDDHAAALSNRHPSVATSSVQATGKALYEVIAPMMRPDTALGHIMKHHEWRCKYDWPYRLPTMVPNLARWITERALDPVPTDEVGMQMSGGGRMAKLSKREQDAEELRRELGGNNEPR